MQLSSNFFDIISILGTNNIKLKEILILKHKKVKEQKGKIFLLNLFKNANYSAINFSLKKVSLKINWIFFWIPLYSAWNILKLKIIQVFQQKCIITFFKILSFFKKKEWHKIHDNSLSAHRFSSINMSKIHHYYHHND